MSETKDVQQYIAHYANGQVRWVMTMKNGLEDGPFISYYESGAKRFRCTYVAGKRQGEYWQYAEDGSLEEKGIYKDNVKTQVCSKDALAEMKEEPKKKPRQKKETKDGSK